MEGRLCIEGVYRVILLLLYLYYFITLYPQVPSITGGVLLGAGWVFT